MKNIIFVVAVLLLSGCEERTQITIVNGSGKTLHDVNVTDGHEVWELGILNAGEERRFRESLSGRGSMEVRWTVGGRQFFGAGCYHARGVPAKGQIVIEGSRAMSRCS